VKTWTILVCLALAGPLGAEEAERPRVPLYTNEDLDRVRPYRDQTGVASRPDPGPPSAGDRPPASAGPARRGRSGGRATGGRGASRGETYWRGEAARVRERVRALDDQAADLRRRIAEKRAEPWTNRPRPPAGPAIAALEARIAALAERRRALENDLEDRARREGALPGWLR